MVNINRAAYKHACCASIFHILIGMYFAHYIFMHKVRMLGVRGTGSGGTGGVPCGPRGSSQLDPEPATSPSDDHCIVCEY